MLKVHIKKLRDLAVLCVEGQIVRGEGLSTLRNVAVSQASAGTMILDLASVDIIDAGGLGVLLELREWALQNGIEFKLENANELVANVLRITHLDSVFDVSSEAPATLCVAIAA